MIKTICTKVERNETFSATETYLLSHANLKNFPSSKRMKIFHMCRWKLNYKADANGPYQINSIATKMSRFASILIVGVYVGSIVGYMGVIVFDLSFAVIEDFVFLVMWIHKYAICRRCSRCTYVFDGVCCHSSTFIKLVFISRLRAN